jgi:predicted nucleic acid-binding protein
MRVYLDLCCLKRPFDDPSEERNRLESEAVLAILAEAGRKVEIVRTAALDIENDQNPLPVRAARVREWLEAVPLSDIPEREVTARTGELIAMGFGNFDAFHLASAEAAGADVLSSCDDRLISLANRHRDDLKVRVVNPVILAEEILK